MLRCFHSVALGSREVDNIRGFDLDTICLLDLRQLPRTLCESGTCAWASGLCGRPSTRDLCRRPSLIGFLHHWQHHAPLVMTLLRLQPSNLGSLLCSYVEAFHRPFSFLRTLSRYPFGFICLHLQHLRRWCLLHIYKNFFSVLCSTRCNIVAIRNLKL